MSITIELCWCDGLDSLKLYLVEILIIYFLITSYCIRKKGVTTFVEIPISIRPKVKEENIKYIIIIFKNHDQNSGRNPPFYLSQLKFV